MEAFQMRPGRHIRKPAALELKVMRLLAGVLLVMLLAAPAGARTLLVMGDSLSAAYGLTAEQGWVNLLAERLDERQSGWSVVNASVSGETTAGGATRIAGELRRHAPDVVAIQLGANDGLRGLPLEQARANLATMIERVQSAGARVLLIGIRIPPNYGPEYADAFHAMYFDLAQRYGTALLPFLLEPIATERAAFMADNVHPNATAQQRLLEHVWPALAPLLGPHEG
ncbi:MAG TPA: arylesterase [Xanthomonadaceae bacterium]|nr:arylesterase [Xanthomonadaceae bacterium]